jgi:hypothetical protein
VAVAEWGENSASSMKSGVVQLLAPVVFHVEHNKNKNPCVSSAADSFSLFVIFAVLGLLRRGLQRGLWQEG